MRKTGVFEYSTFVFHLFMPTEIQFVAGENKNPEIKPFSIARYS